MEFSISVCCLSVLVINGIVIPVDCKFRTSTLSNILLPTCCNLLSESDSDGTRTCSLLVNGSIDEIIQPRTSEAWTAPLKLLDWNVTQTFDLQKSDHLKCHEDTHLETFQPEIDTSHNDSDFHFLLEGRLEFKQMYYEKRDYCINGIAKNELEFKICKENCLTHSLCLPKCCPLGQIYNNLLECTNLAVEITWKPQFYNNPTEKVTPEEQLTLRQHYRQPTIHCTPFLIYLFTSNPAQSIISTSDCQYLRFRVLANGKITFRDHTRKWIFLSTDEFCIDGLIDPSKEISTVIYTCKLTSPVTRGDFQIYPILMLISSMFILLTIAVHVLLWDKQNIHEWNTLSQSVSMFMFFVFLGIASLLSEYRHDLFNTLLCKGIAILAHFFMLSTFLWLTLISFDLWITFRIMDPKGSRTKGITKFIIYSIAGWGIPFALVIISTILDMLYLENEDSELPLPEYGITSCYVASYSQFYYVYIPVAILLSINTILFVYTSMKLYMYRESTKMATKHMRNQRNSFELFAKLFFVMGISWVFEVISWAVSGGDLTWYWFIFDAINIATPIAIFLIFVVKWDILYKLEQKHPILKPLIIPMVYLLQLLRCKRPDHIVEEFTSLKTNLTSLSKSINSERQN